MQAVVDTSLRLVSFANKPVAAIPTCDCSNAPAAVLISFGDVRNPTARTDGNGRGNDGL